MCWEMHRGFRWYAQNPSISTCDFASADATDSIAAASTSFLDKFDDDDRMLIRAIRSVSLEPAEEYPKACDPSEIIGSCAPNASSTGLSCVINRSDYMCMCVPVEQMLGQANLPIDQLQAKSMNGVAVNIMLQIRVSFKSIIPDGIKAAPWITQGDRAIDY